MAGMRTVRLTKELKGGYQQGQVLVCDANSAQALIDRGDAEAVDTATDTESVSAAADPGQPGRGASKPELVAFAVANGWTGEQAEASTRAQIADAFGLE